MHDSLRDYGLGLAVSVAGHAALALLLLANFGFLSRQANQPVQLAIEAAVVQDMEAIRKRQAAERERQAAAERQRREQELARQAEEKRRKAEAERIALAEKKAAEEKRRREEEKRLAEQKRKEAEEKRRREEEARLERERQEAEKRRLEAERKRREAEEARRAAEREAQLRAQLAEEEQRHVAVQAGLLDQWIEVIRQRVRRNWVQPPGAKPGLECEVRVTQIPGGEVVNVRMGRCNGDAVVIRSIENAVYRSSPLPPPADPALFERTLIFMFKPEE